MTAVAEQKKKSKKVDDIATVERFDNGAVIITDVDVPPVPAEPGEAGYDWQPHYPGEKVFVHTHDGITVGLAAISEKRQPTIGFLREARKQPEFEQVLDMVEFISCPEALALVDKWVPTDLISVFEKWSDWNRTSAGE